MAKQGYVKLFRKTVDWEWYTEVNTCHLFVHMLIMSNHDTQKWRGEVVERGSFITSLASLSNETGLSIRQVRTSIKNLQKTGDIDVIATNKNTKIIVVKYGLYQDSICASDKQNDMPNDTIVTNNRQSNDNQTTTNKNVKNLKNVKNDKNSLKEYRVFVENYSDNENLKEALIAFVEMRISMKGFTYRSLELAISKLEKIASNNNVKIEVVNQSVERSWKSFFPLKTETQTVEREELPF